ncbi:programmed cell death protein 7 [Kryptolebias marmoratus]|uniref:Programmed cell death 7 n=1 Tax=Kryptolebias marmoratus TaxID=37003 RepID=A0A3Q3AM13_KRYMA|nr:programmed cell death protein 7 [Kryptolebias marmoratus]
MDNPFQHGQSESFQPPYNGGYLQTQYSAEQRGLPQPDPSAPSWTPPPAFDGQPYGLRYDFPPPPSGGAAFGGPGYPNQYGFDPSVPPPPLDLSSPGHFPGMAPPGPVNPYGSSGVSAFQGFSPQLGSVAPPRYDGTSESDRGLRQRQDHHGEGGGYYWGPPCPPQDRDSSSHPEDEGAAQRRQDEQWLAWFLQSRGTTTGSPQRRQQERPKLISVPALRETLYGSAELASRLEEFCHSLKHNLHDDAMWADSYLRALHVKEELQDKLKLLSDTECLRQLKVKVSRAAQRKARRLRARKALQMERIQAEERCSEKEAAIDKWRLRQIQQVEEKKKEREVKLAADAVLCEVRKKQADVKRMQDILRSLEKLRKLRKEAASRKGIVTEQQCDEAFSSRLEQLRCVIKNRTTLYSAEEKALMVMLEGEQEEERKRERERRVKKERERQLERKRKVDSMLFGDELLADCFLQPFVEYYSQADRSLQALIQIRREWDMFLVTADHPGGSSVPQGWILPDPPSDQAWASALQAADSDGDNL